MATRLYFHVALNALANLPTTEQSSLTIDKNVGDAQTVNRLMNTTIGNTASDISGFSNATVSLQRYYFTRFVSPALSGVTSIAAQTWTYNFAGFMNNTAAEYPVAGANQPVRITCYVWRPSTQTKVGNILDGNSASTVNDPGSTSQIAHNVSFSGALVSGIQDGDVICFEVIFEITQTAATAYQEHFMFNGATVTTTEGATVGAHASFIEALTSNLTFASSVTRLYFHNALSTISNLPTAEQSSLTSDKNGDAQTINRSMDTTKGTSQVIQTLVSNSTTLKQNYYFTRFVSLPLSGVGAFGAGTWTYNIGLNASSISARFPATSTAIPIVCYVWRPSTQAKVGDILDGSSNGLISSVSAANCKVITFNGAALSGIQNGDVLIIEIWFSPTATSAGAWNQQFYYDGTIVTTTNLAAITDHAAFLDVPIDLTFQTNVNLTRSVGTETVSISDSVTRKEGTNRTVSTQTVAVSESVARQKRANRTVSTQSTTVGAGTTTRTKQANRTVTPQTVAVSQTVTRTEGTNRTVATQTVTVGGGTVTRVKGAVRPVATQTVTVGAGVATRVKGVVRAVTLQTVSISESVSRAGAFFKRAVATQTTNISESLSRQKRANRTVSTQTVAISEARSRMKAADRDVPTQTVTVSDIVSRAGAFFKRAVPTQTTAISDSVTRKEGTNRTVTPQTVPVSESVTRSKRANRTVSTQTVTVTAATVTRMKAAARTVLNSVIVSDAVSRAGSTFKRVVTTQVITLSETLARTKGVSRVVPTQTVTVGQTVTRQKKANRTVTPQTVALSDSVARQRALTRRVVQNNFSLFFNGTDGRINCGVNTNIWNKNLTALSISFWIRGLTFTDGNHRTVIARGWGAAYGLDIYYHATLNRFEAEFVTDTWPNRSASGYSTVPYDPSLWYHITVVYDSAQSAANVLKIYVNGSLTGFTQTTGVPGWIQNNTTAPLMLSDSTLDLHGYLKDLRWFNRALSAAEALAISLDVGDSIPSDYRLLMEEGSGVPKDMISATSPTPIIGGGVTWDVEVPPGKFELVTVSDSVDRTKAVDRDVIEPAIVVGASVARLKAAARSVINSVTVSESVSRMKAAKRTVATQTITVGAGVVTRTKGAVRAVALQTVTVGAGVASRIKSTTRTVATQTVTVTGSAIRSLTLKRVVSQTVAVFDNVTGLHEGAHEYARSVIEPLVAVIDSVTRRLTAARVVAPESVAVSGSVTRQKGAIRKVGRQSDYSLVFDGLTSGGGGYIIPNRAAINNLTQFTIAFWMYPTAFSATGTPNIVTKLYPSNNGFIIYFTTNTYTLNWRTVNNVGTGVSATSGYIQTNGPAKWYRIVVTFNETTGLMELYINGVLRASGTNSGVVNAGGVGNLGVNSHGTVKWAGNQADFRLYRRVLSSQEIALDYNGVWILEPDVYMPYTEGSGLPKDVKNAVATVSAAPAIPGWDNVILPPDQENIALADSVTRQAGKGRIVPAETVDVSDSTDRILGILRTIIETVTVTATAARTKAATRAVPAQNVTVGPGVASRIKGAGRTVINSITVTGSVIRRKAANRIVATQTTLVNDIVTRTEHLTRAVNNIIPVNDFVDRTLSIARSIVSFLTISEDVTRTKAASRDIVEEPLDVTDIVTGFKSVIHEFVRSIMEPLVSVFDSVTRQGHFNRSVSETVGGVPVYKAGEVPDTVRAQKVICGFLKANWSISDPPSIDILWDSWYTGQDDITIQCEEMITTQRPQPTNWQFRQYDGYVNIHIFVRELSGIYPDRLDKMRAFIDALFSQNPTALQANGIDLVWPYVFTPVRYENDPEYFHLIIRIQLKYVKNWPQNV